MEIGVGTYLKKINRSLIISKIIEHGKISRADLSTITNLTKATISVQVANLLKEGIIVESQQEYNHVGRKPIMLSLNADAGYALGVDLDYQTITFTVSDILGNPVHSETLKVENSNYKEILQILIDHIREYKEKYSNSRFGIVGVVIGIHGTVKSDQTIGFVPQHQWHNKDLKGDLEKNLGMIVYIENNANLCAFAEKVFNCHRSENLISISMYSGIGLGFLINGELVKGYQGYAGEMGHMIINPNGELCNCGNSGCWELYTSEVSFFKQLSKKLNKTKLTYKELENLIELRNPIVMTQMDVFIKYISIGLNNIINILNPDTVVFNSELLQLFPDVESKIKTNLKSSISNYKEFLLSRLGRNACVLGACTLAIKNFLEIPDLRLPFEQNVLEQII
ncbi:ROK family transcriptional regulator [Neobacillus drentensis]|uniref:ROK family transcriptional regulator n=1 Tax=Neobacillus drentensis TaxID=220684 RepID=UPI001F1E20E5|nr:ROK family transcriptional regulator [Neobacillus drentensis]ULT57893.1 ROK family transcriptional regulator [Neobacillus drentensis]